ncbi:MAG: hypothetical protein KBD01_19835 [Acidobacteria bacterium]|nr:hypothetical protein [Acidobacteriota bacterium]
MIRRTRPWPLAVSLSAALACGFALAASQPPALHFEDNIFNRPHVNTYPRPFRNRTNVTTATTFYFEVLVPDVNGDAGKVDPDSITATLRPASGAPIPMLLANRQFAAGFSGQVISAIDSGDWNGEAVYIVPAAALDPARTYTIEVYARTLDGLPIDPAQDSWSFTTRPSLADPSVSWSIDLASPTVRWEGWFWSGLLKPNFDTSRLFDQLDSYTLMDGVRASNPDAWSLQRDWPLTSDFWHNGVFDGNPNPVRERETRRVTAVNHVGTGTALTLADIEEGPLYGIAPNRPLSLDYHPDDTVTIADRSKSEQTQVLSVDDALHRVIVRRLSTTAWDLNYLGSHPADNPETPDNFTLPLCYLRKYSPAGTLRYYWARIDDEWDIVHGQHGRRLVVNFSFVPLDLSRTPVPARTGGHGSISPPKNYEQWHEFVRQLVFHLIDRYGPATQDFYFSVGNECNFSSFWGGTNDEFYEYYDYTVNAVLTAFEDRALDASRVIVGGIEAAGLGGNSYIKDALYHCSGAAARPGGGIAEQNYVCANPAFAGKRAARVQALCDAFGGKGSPLDFVSIHEYEHTHVAVADMTQIRDDALAMDPAFFDRLNITSFEATPDWIPRPDPASRAMYLGNGFASGWCADWMQRMVARAMTDARYARHESILTVWPFDYNGDGISAVTGLMRVDDDGDGTEDRISTIKKDIFNYVALQAKLGRDLAALPDRDVSGIRLAGVRSVTPRSHAFLLYAYDNQDTESREPAAFAAHLSLTGVPWPVATVRTSRVDRDRSSPYRAYQALPKKNLYRPAELAQLEASDELVEVGPPQDLPVSGGALEIETGLAVNGIALVEITGFDGDHDGHADAQDNCPAVFNPEQLDADGDLRGAACECDDADPAAWAEPAEVGQHTVGRADAAVVLNWPSLAAAAGHGTRYDVVSGALSELLVDASFARAECLLDGAAEPPVDDPSALPPPGEARYTLVRGQNGCGSGTFGSGTPLPDPRDLLDDATPCP